MEEQALIESLPAWAPSVGSWLAFSLAADLAAWLVCRSGAGRRGRGILLVPAMILALAAPFWVPRRFLVLRVVLLILAATRPPKYWAALKAFPALAEGRRGPGAFCLFTNLAGYTLDIRESFVRERPGAGPTRGAKLATLGLGLGRLAAGIALLEASWRWRPWEASFALDHMLKLVELYLIAGGGVDAILACLRLAGFRVRDLLDWPVLARNPADFWRRYNTMVHSWFMEHLFPACGGLRNAGRAIFIVFLLSGILHEYVFSGASLQGWGYQLSFFLWQGVGVLMTSPLAWRQWRKEWPRRRQPRASRTGIALRIAGQLLFIYVTSIFFMASFEKSIPVHPGSPPILP